MQISTTLDLCITELHQYDGTLFMGANFGKLCGSNETVYVIARNLQTQNTRSVYFASATLKTVTALRAWNPSEVSMAVHYEGEGLMIHTFNFQEQSTISIISGFISKSFTSYLSTFCVS